MAPKYKLIYFDAHGLIEPARFILANAGVEYEDVRIKMDDKWKEMKKETPFGKLPILEFDGKRLTQSTVICRYLAKQFGLTGKDDYESILCDEIVATVVDIVNESRGLFKTTAKAHELRHQIISTGNAQLFSDNYEDLINQETREKFIKETLTFFYDRFDKIVKKNDGYTVGNSLTWADFVLMHHIEMFTIYTQTDILSSFPNLKALKDKVTSLPAISNWIKTRPATPF